MKDSLFDLIRRESNGKPADAQLRTLMSSDDIDPHQLNDEGQTAFNLAAALHADGAGRLMTLYWLEQALAGKGPKGLNDPSGIYNSSLAQYMAKWLTPEEFRHALDRAVTKGLKVDMPNASGWTPLTAAAALGRVEIVEMLIPLYSREALCVQTTEEYETVYNDAPVTYPKGLNAVEIAQERIFQDEEASEDMGQNLWICMDMIAGAIASK